MNLFKQLNYIIINNQKYFEITDEIVNDIMKKCYYINEHGQIYNAILNKFEVNYLDNKNGYLYHNFKTMSGNCTRQSIHRIICFIFNYDSNYKSFTVNHKDTNKLNNNFTNLEWMTSADNTRHALLNNLLVRGEDCSWSKLTENQVHKICKILEDKSYSRLSDISKKFNCKTNMIRDIALGITWTHISKQYNINYNMRSKMTDQEVETICQLFCKFKEKSFLYKYYLVLFTLDWEESSQNRKRVYKLYNRDPTCFKYITDKYDF